MSHNCKVCGTELKRTKLVDRFVHIGNGTMVNTVVEGYCTKCHGPREAAFR